MFAQASTGCQRRPAPPQAVPFNKGRLERLARQGLEVRVAQPSVARRGQRVLAAQIRNENAGVIRIEGDRHARLPHQFDVVRITGETQKQFVARQRHLHRGGGQ